MHEQIINTAYSFALSNSNSLSLSLSLSVPLSLSPFPFSLTTGIPSRSLPALPVQSYRDSHVCLSVVPHHLHCQVSSLHCLQNTWHLPLWGNKITNIILVHIRYYSFLDTFSIVVFILWYTHISYLWWYYEQHVVIDFTQAMPTHYAHCQIMYMYMCVYVFCRM